VVRLTEAVARQMATTHQRRDDAVVSVRCQKGPGSVTEGVPTRATTMLTRR
jgi:hypothetical protein